MKMIKGNFARKYNKMLSTVGKVWQDRFYDESLRNNAILLTKIEYIHNNPVRAKLTTTPGEYPFSSYIGRDKPCSYRIVSVAAPLVGAMNLYILKKEIPILSSYNYYFGNNYSGIPQIDKLEL